MFSRSQLFCSVPKCGKNLRLCARNASNRRPVAQELPKIQSNIHFNTGFVIGTGVVQQRIRQTYRYVLGSLTITGASAVGLYHAGLPAIILGADPLVYLGTMLAINFPLLLGTEVIDYEKNPVLKHIVWTGLNVSLAGSLSAVGLFGGPLITQAMLVTGCTMGGLSLVALKAKPGSLQRYEAPLGIGLGIVTGAALGHMLFPMPLLDNIALYGGLAVFTGLTLTDTQKLIRNAQLSGSYDPINESLDLYLNTLNIFVKVIRILAKLNKKKE